MKSPEITPQQLAIRWNMCIGTLKNWRTAKNRALGKGIPFNRRGGKITYDLWIVEEYELKNKIIPENYKD